MAYVFIFFAIICGLLEIIPFIRNITGTTLTVFVAAVQGASLPMLVGIVGIYVAVQFIQEWVLSPIIVCDHFEPLKPYGFLMGEIKTGKGKPGLIKKNKEQV